MARANQLISSFNGGELSPLLSSRPDLEKYQAGLLLCENAIPRVQGALERRGGTRFVSAVKDSSKRPWLVDFIYSVNDAFVLEFGDQYIRFYRNRGVLTPGSVTAWNSGTAYLPGDLASSGGVNYYCTLAHTNHAPPNATYWYPMPSGVLEIPTPYALADLTADDGSFAIRYVQSGDVIYLAHPKYAPRKLTRLTNVNWSLAVLTAVGGPFKDQNTDITQTVQVSGGTSVGTTVTLTATSQIFKSTHVGGLFYIEPEDFSGAKPWAQRMAFALNALCRSDGKYYKATTLGTAVSGKKQVTGDVKPVHTQGRVWDGDGNDLASDDYAGIGIEWEFQHAGYGWMQITGYTDASHATALVLSTLPDDVLSTPSHRWAMGAWSDGEGWPDNVTFFRERLAFWKGRNGYFSVAGDFENFRAKTFGVTDASSAINMSVQSGRGDAVKWLAPTAKLLIGTGGGEVAVFEQTANQVFGPGNTKSDPQGEWGSRGVAPARIGAAVLFAEKSGRALRELKYDAASDTFDSSDATDYAEHLFTPAGIIDMAYGRKPHSVVWCARDDGLLVGLTYSAKQGTMGWFRAPIGVPDQTRDADGFATSFGVVESVAVIPTPDGARDELWLIVKRTINGSTARYVEFMTTEYRTGDDQALTGYYDAHLIYNGSPVTTLTGLDHLEGCTVKVKADGAQHADRTVASGSITLSAAASKVVVGLSAPMRGRTMPLEGGAGLGSAQGQLKRVHKVRLRLRNTLGGKVGPDFTTMDNLEYRSADDPMNFVAPLFSGLKTQPFPADYDGDATVAWAFDEGFPATISAMVAELETYES